MKQYSKVQRLYFIATVLGLAACVTNLMASWIEPRYIIPAGNVFLFIAAGTLGAVGTAIAVLVAEVPQTFLHNGYLEFIRTAILAMSWAYLAGRNSRYAGFPVIAAVWLLGFAPALLLCYLFDAWPSGLTPGMLGRIAFADIFIAIVAGSLLLNQNIWIALAQRPRRFSLSQLLTHVVTLTAVVSMSAAFALPELGLAISGKSTASIPLILTALVVSVLVPAFISIRLSDLIRRSTQEMFSTNLLHTTRELTFSGLSSNFWRRKNSSDDITVTSSGDSQTKMMAHATGSGQFTPDQGICAVDSIGTVTFVNRKFLKLLDIKDREVTGKKIDALPMHRTLQEQILKILGETQRGGSHVVEVKLNQLPDNLRYFEVRADKAESLEGSTIASPGGVILSVKDITDRRAVETHLLQAQRLASLGNFVTGIGHAFNNALTSIVGKASFAQRCGDAAQQSRALIDIIASAQRAGERVKQLMEFAEGQPTLFKDTDLRELVKDRQALIREMLGDHFEVSVGGSAHTAGIHCDQNLILQAVTNLVLNARDSYQGKPGAIEISVDIETIPEQVSAVHVGARPGTFARLRVKDFGIGMTPDVLAHAFDPLFTTKRSTGRTGLGLSTVFAIVRAHDGFLTVESASGKGTSVSIYLPIVQLKTASEVVRAEIEANRAAVKLETGKGRILVVEDETTVRELVTQMLGLLGYEVESCSNGDEALTEFKSKSFDLVLVDMAMPRMDGPSLIQRLREINSKTNALIMSGYGDTLRSEKIREPLLSKPFDLETLAKTVKKAIEAGTEAAK